MARFTRGTGGGGSSSNTDEEDTQDDPPEPELSAGSDDRLDAPGGVDTSGGNQNSQSNRPDRSAGSDDRLEAPGGPDTSVGSGSQTNNGSSTGTNNGSGTETNNGNSNDVPEGPPTEPADGGEPQPPESDGGGGLVSGFEDAVHSARDLDQEVRSGYRDLRTDANETFRDVTNTEGLAEAVEKRQQEGYQQTRDFTVDSIRHATGKDVDRGVYGSIQDMQERFEENNVKTGPGPILGGFSGAGGSIFKVGKNAKSYVKAAKGVEASTIRGSATGERVVGGAVKSGEFVVEGTNRVATALKTGTIGVGAVTVSEIERPANPNEGQTELEPMNPTQDVSELDASRPEQGVSEVGIPETAPGERTQGEIDTPSNGPQVTNGEVDVTIDASPMGRQRGVTGEQTEETVEFDETEIEQRRQEERGEIARQGYDQTIYEQEQEFGDIEHQRVPEQRDELRGNFERGQDIEQQSEFDGGDYGDLTPYQQQLLRGRQGAVGRKSQAEETSFDAPREFPTGGKSVTEGKVTLDETTGELDQDPLADEPTVNTEYMKHVVETRDNISETDAPPTTDSPPVFDSPPTTDNPPEVENPPGQESPPSHGSPPEYRNPPETETPPETPPETGNPNEPGTPNITKNPNVPGHTTYTPTPPSSPPRPPRVPDLDGDIEAGNRRRRKFKFATDTFEADVYTPEEIQSGEAFKGLD